MKGFVCSDLSLVIIIYYWTETERHELQYCQIALLPSVSPDE